jgi:hypothetical protein
LIVNGLGFCRIFWVLVEGSVYYEERCWGPAAQTGRTSTLCINLGYHGSYKTAFPYWLLDVLRMRIKLYALSWYLRLSRIISDPNIGIGDCLTREKGD